MVFVALLAHFIAPLLAVVLPLLAVLDSIGLVLG
jgi:hypothetical protein